MWDISYAEGIGWFPRQRRATDKTETNAFGFACSYSRCSSGVIQQQESCRDPDTGAFVIG